MQSELKHLISEFEKEMWLYADGTISEQRRKFWDDKLKTYPELEKLFERNNDFIAAYNSIPNPGLENNYYKSSIKNAVAQKTLREKLKEFLTSLNGKRKNKLLYAKLAFGGSLAAAAITVLLLSNKPNPVKKISSDLLDWNAEKISTQIDNVGNSITFIKDEDLKKYIMYKIATDEWQRNIYSIKGSINKIKNEIKDESL